MKAKYLGTFWIEDVSSSGEYLSRIVNEEDREGYDIELFMRASSSEPYDGIMTETNTSAIICKISDCGDEYKLWRIW